MDAKAVKAVFALSVAVLIVLTGVLASEDALPVTTLPEVVIEGAITIGVRTFTKMEIEKSGARTAADFLHAVSGIAIRQDAASGGKQFARIGGSNVNQVMVLVDGIRLADVGSGEADLSRIPVDWIESVEISTGGGSTYGSESIGGTISIHTRSGASNGFRVHADGSETISEVGALQEWSNGTSSAAIGVTREQGSGRYRFRVTEEDGNGPFTIRLGEVFRRENNHRLRDRIIGNFEHKLATHRINGSVLVERGEFGLPGYLAPRPTLMASQREQYRQFKLGWSLPTEFGTASATASLQNQSRDYSDPDPYSYLHESHEASERATLAGSWQKTILGIHAIWSNRFEREVLESGVIKNSRAVRNRWQSGIQLSRKINFSRSGRQWLNCGTGANVERFGDSEIKVLPSADVSYSNHVWIPMTLGGRGARAYLAPSFYSLFWNDELLAQGNPQLQPESSVLLQAYVRAGSKSRFATKLELAATRNRVEDLIYWRQAFDGRWTPQNLRRASLDQFSVTVKQVIAPRTVDAEVSMDWLEARDQSGARVTDGKYLIYRPLRTIHAGLTVQSNGFSGALQAHWLDKQAVLETNSKWLQAYTLVDAVVRYGFQLRGSDVDAGVRCNNILEEDYRVVRFAPMPLREVSAFISIHFGRVL